MSINVALVPYLLLFTAVLPAILAIRLAHRQNRSLLTSGVVTLILGFTFIGGWVYLGAMNLFNPKNVKAH